MRGRVTRLVLDALVFGSTDGCLHAVTASGGTPLWKHALGGPSFATACVVPSAHRVYATSQAGALHCVDLRDGSLCWSHQGQYRGHSSPCAMGAAGDVVCAAGVDGTLSWFTTADGRLHATHTLPADVFSSPVMSMGDGRCLVGCRDDGLWCLHVPGLCMRSS